MDRLQRSGLNVIGRVCDPNEVTQYKTIGAGGCRHHQNMPSFVLMKKIARPEQIKSAQCNLVSLVVFF